MGKPAFKRRDYFMQTDNESASFNWDEAGTEWQSTPDNLGVVLKQPKTNYEKLAETCGRAFACTCGAGGGFLASHFGCMVSPAVAIATGSSGAALPILSSLTSLGATVLTVVTTSVGMGIWHRSWKKKKLELANNPNPEMVRRLERSLELNKTLTLAGAIGGMVLTLGFNLLADPEKEQAMQTRLDIYSLQQANGMNIGSENKSPFEILEDLLQVCGIIAQDVPDQEAPKQPATPLVLER